MSPKRYRAQDMQTRKYVEGWYAELHLPRYDSDMPDCIVGYDTLPSLFNDEPGSRSDGSYWHSIDPTTLQPIETLF